jgi:hypothetical protein
MKLYTEIEVKKMIKDMDSFSNGGIDYRINQMTSIKLPSDEEIDEFSKIFNLLNNRDMFITGAHWVLNQIKQQDK